MRQAGMLEAALDDQTQTTTEHLRATRLGHIAVRHFLTPATVLLFRKALNQSSELAFFDLLIVAASSEDCEPVMPVDFEELDAIANLLSQEKSVLLHRSRRELADFLGIDGKRLLAALKMGLVARDWTRSGDADEVAEKYNCYPFEAERLRESLDRLLLAMLAIFEKVKDEKSTESPETQLDEHISMRERVKVLQQMVAAGINESAATLTVINGVGPKLAKRLHDNGIADIEDLAAAEIEELLAIQRLSRDRAKRWIAEAKEKILFRSAFCYRESDPAANVKTREWPPEVDPYRLRRALDLKIAGAEGGMFRITGGLEPHIVRTVDGKLICDCQDAAKAIDLPVGQRYQCKHALAVMLHRGDRKLKKLASQLNKYLGQDQLNLFDLWFGNSQSSAPRKRA